MYNRLLITEYTDDETLPREVLNQLKPKFEAIFNHYKNTINYVPTEANPLEGTAA